jgi:Na+/proline symporter
MAANTVLAAVGGPLSGLFLFAMLFPWANKKGAIVGVIASAVIVCWICIGAQTYKPWIGSLPVSISGCSSNVLNAAGFWSVNNTQTNETIWFLNNQTINLNELSSSIDLELTGVRSIYKLSFVLYGLTAVALVFIFGIPVSLATGEWSLKNLDSRLIWQGYHYICCCLPKSQRDHMKQKSFNPKNLNQEYSQDPLMGQNIKIPIEILA